MNIQQAAREIVALKEQIAELTADRDRHQKRIKLLERVWHRFKDERGIPVHAAKPIAVPPRPQCVRMVMPHLYEEPTTDG